MNKFKFYLLSFTWGLPMTLIGCVAAFVLRSLGYKPTKYGYCYHFEIGQRWGGINLGFFIITDDTPSEHTKAHEHGHAYQNCYWGFLFPFAVAIPSAVRYWYRELKYNRKGQTPTTQYDDIWFEGDATKRGAELLKGFEVKDGN